MHVINITSLFSICFVKVDGTWIFSVSRNFTFFVNILIVKSIFYVLHTKLSVIKCIFSGFLNAYRIFVWKFADFFATWNSISSWCLTRGLHWIFWNLCKFIGVFHIQHMHLMKFWLSITLSVKYTKYWTDFNKNCFFSGNIN